MKQNKLFYVGVKALIRDSEGATLVLLADVTKHSKNSEPYWDIPGGRVQEGEAVLDTLRREVSEETGVDSLSNVRFITSVVSHHEIPLADGSLAGLILMVYAVSIPVDSEITISGEHVSCAWVSPAEAAHRLSHKYPAEFTDSL